MIETCEIPKFVCIYIYKYTVSSMRMDSPTPKSVEFLGVKLKYTDIHRKNLGVSLEHLVINQQGFSPESVCRGKIYGFNPIDQCRFLHGIQTGVINQSADIRLCLETLY